MSTRRKTALALAASTLLTWGIWAQQRPAPTATPAPDSPALVKAMRAQQRAEKDLDFVVSTVNTMMGDFDEEIVGERNSEHSTLENAQQAWKVYCTLECEFQSGPKSKDERYYDSLATMQKERTLRLIDDVDRLGKKSGAQPEQTDPAERAMKKIKDYQAQQKAAAGSQK